MGVTIVPRNVWGAAKAIKPIPPMFTPVEYVLLSFVRRMKSVQPPTFKYNRGYIMDHQYLQSVQEEGRGSPSDPEDFFNPQAMRFLQMHDQKRDVDIRYNFVIAPDLLVYKGRGWSHSPNLPSKYRVLHRRAVYIGYMVDFDEELPPDEFLNVKKEIIEYGIRNCYVSKTFTEVTLEHIFTNTMLDNLLAGK